MAVAQRRRGDEVGIIFRNEHGCGHPASAVDGGHGERGREQAEGGREGAEQAKMIDFFGDVGRRIEEDEEERTGSPSERRPLRLLRWRSRCVRRGQKT